MRAMAAATLAAMSAVAAAAAKEPVEYRLPKMRATPVVDGVVGADEWRDCVGGFGFCTYPGDTAGPVPVSYKIGRAGDRLFIAAERPVGPAGVGVPKSERTRSWGVTSDDNFEFVFVGDRTTEEPDFKHLIVNSSGEKMSLAFSGGKRTRWTAPSMVAKSVVTTNLWTFEMSIAFSDIGFEETPPENHSIRLCHTFFNVGSKSGYQSSARPKENTYFTAQRTIPLVFDDNAPAVELLEGASDRGKWRTTLRLANPTDKELKLAVKVQGRPSDSQPGGIDETVPLAPGEERVMPVEGPIIGDELVDMMSEVRDAEDGRCFAFRRINWRPNAPAPEWVFSADAGRKLRVKFAYYPSYDKMRLRADVSRFENRPEAVFFSLVDSAGAELAKTKVVVGTNNLAETIWDVPDLKAATQRSGKGEYKLLASVPGEKADEYEFRRDVFGWEGYKGGSAATVPAPFTPVARRPGANAGEEVVSVVLREHTIDGRSGMWKQVVAAGKPLLARPMRLVGDSGSVSVEQKWDCDGCCELFLTLPAGEYGSLSIEIPVCAERAKLMHACAFGLRGNTAGEIPHETGLVWASRMLRTRGYIGDYLPYVWIGGPLRGIAVFGESDRGWETVDGGPSCQEIWREDDGTVVLKLNIIQKKAVLTAPRTIHLGMQATPTKPMEDGWRGIGIGTLLGSCKSWGAYQGCDSVKPFDGTDEFFRKMGEARRTGRQDKAYMSNAVERCVAMSGATGAGAERVRKNYAVNFAIAMRESAQRAKSPDKRLVFYTNGRGVHLGSAEGITFCDEWERSAFAARPYAFSDTSSYGLDPCASFRDYAAFWYEKMLSTKACDYLYWDCIYCQPNTDLVGTEAYVTPSGETQPGCGIFNMRALVRRGAALQSELGLECRRNWVHMTNTALSPILSFAGVNYDWEDVDGDKPLHERYSRARIQAETIGRQHGNKVAVMGYFATKDRKSAKLQRLERCGAGLCLTHEIGWGRVPAWGAARRRLVDLGYTKPDAKVWNYWDEDVPFPVAITGGETSALAFAQGGRAVVVASDWSGGGEYVIRPDAKALGLKAGFRARNIETGEEIPVSDGAAKVSLGKYDFAMVVFE